MKYDPYQRLLEHVCHAWNLTIDQSSYYPCQMLFMRHLIHLQSAQTIFPIITMTN